MTFLHIFCPARTILIRLRSPTYHHILFVQALKKSTVSSCYSHPNCLVFFAISRQGSTLFLTETKPVDILNCSKQTTRLTACYLTRQTAFHSKETYCFWTSSHVTACKESKTTASKYTSKPTFIPLDSCTQKQRISWTYPQCNQISWLLFRFRIR
jgi:hypothetical protein